MKKITLIIIQVLIFLLTCCAQGQEEKELINALKLKDANPPKLLSVSPIDEFSVRIVFDKKVSPVESSFAPYKVKGQDFAIEVSFSNQMDATKEYNIEGVVKDQAQNTTYFNVKVWGYNPSPAGLLINEFTTKSSGKQCDRTELYVYKSGIVSGFTLYDGIPSNYKSMVSLGNLKVNKGDYIVVWWCDKLDETVNSHPSDNVYNICANVTSSPSDNNGIQVLAQSPSQGAIIQDCVVYCSFESTQYSGFGTKEVYDRVQKAIAQNWWTGPAISSSNSTGTRSMFRMIGTNDTDTCNDWNICQTGKSTFGSENLTETY